MINRLNPDIKVYSVIMGVMLMVMLCYFMYTWTMLVATCFSYAYLVSPCCSLAFQMKIFFKQIFRNLNQTVREKGHAHSELQNGRYSHTKKCYTQKSLRFYSHILQFAQYF